MSLASRREPVTSLAFCALASSLAFSSAWAPLRCLPANSSPRGACGWPGEGKVGLGDRHTDAQNGARPPLVRAVSSSTRRRRDTPSPRGRAESSGGDRQTRGSHRGATSSLPRKRTCDHKLAARARTKPSCAGSKKRRAEAMALDPDTYTSPESYQIALLAAGAAVRCSRAGDGE